MAEISARAGARSTTCYPQSVAGDTAILPLCSCQVQPAFWPLAGSARPGGGAGLTAPPDRTAAVVVAHQPDRVRPAVLLRCHVGLDLAPSCSAVRQRERVLSRPRTSSPGWAVGTGIAGPTAGFNSHRPCRSTRLRSIRLQRRPAPCRTRQLPRGTSLNPHAFRRCRSVIPRSCRSLFRHDVARLRRPAGSVFWRKAYRWSIPES